MSDTPLLNRRKFLATATTATATVAATASLPHCAPRNTNCLEKSGPITVADIPVGKFLQPTGGLVVIARDSTGFYAFSNQCTHLQCTLPCPDQTNTIYCPCHGAIYNANGDLVTPAPGAINQLPLNHYEVRFTGTGPTATVEVSVAFVELDRARRFPPP